MAKGHRWRHGWIPLTTQVAHEYGHKWDQHHGTAAGLTDTARKAQAVDSAFAQGAAHHLQQASAHAAEGNHRSARNHLEAAQAALKSGVEATRDDTRRQVLEDLHTDVSKHLSQNTSAQADEAIRRSAGRNEHAPLGTVDITQLLPARQNAQPKGLPGAPKRGERININGVDVTVTQVAETGGVVHIFGVDDRGNPHRTTIRR